MYFCFINLYLLYLINIYKNIDILYIFKILIMISNIVFFVDLDKLTCIIKICVINNCIVDFNEYNFNIIYIH